MMRLHVDVVPPMVIEGMVPAAYVLFATETVPAEAWQDPAVWKRHDGKGLAVTLVEAAARLVELRITS